MDTLGTVFSAGSAGPAPLWQQLLTGGLFGMGELGNIMSESQRNSLLSSSTDYMKYLTNLAQHPEIISQMATKTAAPLSNALIQSVMNTVQGDMASRGLAQAPGIFAASESQALAPYVMQNQNQALQTVMQSLGLPMSGASTAGQFLTPPQNMSPALAQFLRTLGTNPFGSSTNSPAVTGWPPGMPLPTLPLSSGTNVQPPGLTFDWSTFPNLVPPVTPSPAPPVDWAGGQT